MFFWVFFFFSLSLSHIASMISCDDVGKLRNSKKMCWKNTKGVPVHGI